MNKITLYNGSKQIKTISVLSLFRDCSPYLDFFFKAMDDFENMYDVEFSYFILENNSKDDTRTKLKKFSKNRKCKLLLLELDKDYYSDELAMNLERINTLATLRNKLKDTFAPFTSDYILMIDSGIYFKAEVLKDMFSYNPEKNNIVMMSPPTNQIYSKEMIINRPEFTHIKSHIENLGPSSSGLITLGHMYDTYSTITKEGIHCYPLCIRSGCLLCKNTQKHFNYDFIPEDEEISEVYSTFGGFALITSENFNNTALTWSTICLNMSKKTSICEWVSFCDRLRMLSGKKIVILQNVQGVYRTN